MKSSLKQEKVEDRHYRLNKKYVSQGLNSPWGLGSIQC